MQHRGTASPPGTIRVIRGGPTPEPVQKPSLAGGQIGGTMGSTAGRPVWRQVRIDRAADALDAGTPRTSVASTSALPSQVRFEVSAPEMWAVA